MKKLIAFFIVLSHPSCWMRNSKTSPALTKFILDNLEAGELPIVEKYATYTMMFSGVCLWCANYPYAYGNLHSVCDQLADRLPSRYAVYRLRKAELKGRYDTEKQIKQHINDHQQKEK